MAVIITGAARGIGKAVALALAKEGTAVVMVDRAAEPLNEAVAKAKASGGKTETVVGDVADPETAATSVKRAVGAFGKLDGLSHNAGIQRYGTAVSTPDETWNEVLAVNLTAAFYFARAAFRNSSRRKAPSS
jgi:NAD(P)-dependent dehydrogenase (short-subunit alcohol dehydrogenase family)